MKLWLVSVGRPTNPLREAIRDFEQRVGRYWSFEVIEVREEKARARQPDAVRAAEAARLLERLPDGAELIAVTRKGEAWSSPALARYLEKLAVQAHAGAAFVIGGALGLGPELLARANRKLALSALTLPHELARLVLVEQLYRAGTILRGEPYHKGSAP